MTDTPTLLTVQATELPAGLTFDRYRILEKIGAGGMGVVYKALHTGLDRTVAIKVLNAEAASDPEFVERFQREAQVMARMESHPNVVQVFDCGTLPAPSGQPYLAMELLAGKTLEEVLRASGRLPPEEALDCVEKVLAGLKEAHAAGVVHRDVKPANVFVGKTVKVLDFGLATGRPLLHRKPTGAATDTRPMGTPCYVSPEQAQGKTVGPTSDLYSVGILLYELLSGAVPFPLSEAPSVEEVEQVLRRHLEDRPVPLLDVVDGVSRNLSDFVAKLLSKDPARRCVSAEVARAEIRELLKELGEAPTKVTGQAAARGVAAPSDTKHEPTQKIERPVASTDKALAQAFPKRRAGRLVALVAGLSVLAVAVVAIALWQSSRVVEERPVADVPRPPEPPPERQAVKPPEPTREPTVGEPTKEPEVEIAPLPKLPKANGKTPKAAVVAVRTTTLEPPTPAVKVSPRCASLEDWRADERRRADDIERAAREAMLASKAPREKIREELETLDAVRRQIGAASTDVECDRAIHVLTGWAQAHGL